MPTSTINVEARITALNAVLTDTSDQDIVKEALTTAGGDWSVALKDLKTKLPASSVSRLEFAHTLADLTDDNVHVVKATVEDL